MKTLKNKAKELFLDILILFFASVLILFPIFLGHAINFLLWGA